TLRDSHFPRPRPCQRRPRASSIVSLGVWPLRSAWTGSLPRGTTNAARPAGGAVHPPKEYPMRTILAVSAILALIVAPLRGDDQSDALAIIEKAIKAHGGADALTKAQLAIRTGTGTMSLFGKDVVFKDEVVWKLPEHVRLTLDVGPDQGKT